MATSVHDIPGVHQETYQLRGHAAATATEKAYCWVAPFDCKLRSVDIIWDAAITGVDTNTTHVNLLDTDGDGAGTTEIANLDYTDALDGIAGVNTALFAPAASAYRAMSAGDKLAIQLEKVGNGLLLPTALVVIKYEGA